MRIIILLATILFICSCSYTGHVIKEVIPEENGTIEVHFCPVDDCEGVLLGYLEDSIDIKCAFFDLELEEVIALLDSKDAKVVTDEDNKIANAETKLNIILYNFILFPLVNN